MLPHYSLISGSIRGLFVLLALLSAAALPRRTGASPPPPPGFAIAILAARSTTNMLGANVEAIDATIANTGAAWYTAADPAFVSVRAAGLSVPTPAAITALAPGERTVVQVGVRRAAGIKPGTQVPGEIVAWTSNGASAIKQTPLTIGVPRYTATIASLSHHDVPQWYDNAKFGIFIHYGLYSIPAWAPVGGVYAEWYWHSMERTGSLTFAHQLQTYGPTFQYDDFIPQFTAKAFDPRTWVELFKAAGARYFVFVAKHHDGFALFRTKYSHRNSVEMGPHKDLVKALVDADRRYTPQIHPGLYYSLPEWYNPAYPGTLHNRDHFPGGPPHDYITGKPIPYTGYIPVKSYVRDFQVPQMKELIDRYHPDILWCDIGGPNNSLVPIAHLYNEALDEVHPREVAVDNRCGVSVHDFVTPEYRTFPDTVASKWETTRGIDPHSFGFNAATPNSAYISSDALIQELVDVVSKNGNFLLDIGPQADGAIPTIMQDRLRAIGAWLRINGEAIYDTTYWWRTAADGNLRFTIRPNKAFYITSLVRPGAQVVVNAPVPIRPGNAITLLGWSGPALHWTQTGGKLIIDVPSDAQQSGNAAWAFKIDWLSP